ncbi:hypothetical protein AJ78_08376 [Emergomyces pasteurianus Ep9510]|uniref:Uncharacterized protein n=1 Tax=Emergomyces pasteurianus Ep9510 TaxID=1447872 RepID=A0A1J9Q428_9EURO|nr:hypothetical protein AJ78_08376 [Emergomyces pasteurianus Ep9510]
MDIVTIYSAVTGGVLVTLTLIRIICSLKSRINTISMLISKHLTYPCLLKRHRLFGPWTRANVLLYIVYGVVTIFFIAFRVSSASEAARQTETLSLVNMRIIFIATHLSFLADGLAKLQARAAVNEFTFFSAFVSDPHELSEPVSQYETVLVIVSDFGIADVLSYLKQLLHGYNTFTSSIRRVHLMWQVKTLNIAIAAQPLLNSLLINNILEMSFYMEFSIKVEDEKTFRKHKRAMLYHNQSNYKKIISSEVFGDYIPRLPNTHEECDRLLVMSKIS